MTDSERLEALETAVTRLAQEMASSLVRLTDQVVLGFQVMNTRLRLLETQGAGLEAQMTEVLGRLRILDGHDAD